VERDAFVFGGFVSLSYFSSISAIFDVGCGAKIGFSVVEGVVVLVVGEHIGRGFEDFAIHKDGSARTALADAGATSGVEIAIVRDDVPVVLAEPVVIVGVNDGEFALCERDDADGAAKTNRMIKSECKQDQPIKPARELNFETNSHTPSPWGDSAEGGNQPPNKLGG